MQPNFDEMVDDIFEQIKDLNNTDCVLEYQNINGVIKYFINGKEVTKFEYDMELNKAFPHRNDVIYIPSPYTAEPYKPYITTPKPYEPWWKTNITWC